MKKLPLLLITGILLISGCIRKTVEIRPPLAEVKVVEETYFGTKVSDPYRYMENLKDSSVLGWFTEQSDYSRSILNRIPGRQSLIDKMQEFDKRNSSKIGYLVITDSDRFFYLKTLAEDQTAKLYFRDGYKGTESLIFDSQTFGKDSIQKYSISYFSPSDDGTKVAIELGLNGAENSVLITLDVKSRSLFPEQIDRVWWAFPSWLPDGSGFLYNRMQSDNIFDKNRQKGSKAYLHMLGTDPMKDKEIFS